MLVGATVVLSITSWERRFILEQRLVDLVQNDNAGLEQWLVELAMAQNNTAGEVNSTAQGEGEVEGGSGEDKSGGSADGSYGMMLMSSTHHHFAGLFTIRKPGAPPVTQLLVRGSPV